MAIRKKKWFNYPVPTLVASVMGSLAWGFVFIFIYCDQSLTVNYILLPTWLPSILNFFDQL